MQINDTVNNNNLRYPSFYILFEIYIKDIIKIQQHISNQEETTEEEENTPTRHKAPTFSNLQENLKGTTPLPKPIKRSKWKLPTKTNTIIYEDYIRSTEWLQSQVRRRVIVRDGFECKMCQAPYQLEVHHITYQNLGAEKEEDLVTLCRDCHEFTHEMAGKGAGYYPPLKRP